MWGPIAAAGISGIGSLLGGMMQQRSSAKMAQQQMDFQERMSSTAHQREVQDLRAAGLNPILSAKHGGASSPSGAMGTAVNYLGDAAKSAVSSAMAAEQMEAQVDLAKAQTIKTMSENSMVQQTTANLQAENPNISARLPNLEAQTARLQQETRNLTETERNIQAELSRIRAGTGLIHQQTATEKWDTQRSMVNLSILEQNLTSAASDAEKAKIIYDFLKTPAGRAAVQMGLFGKSASDTTSSLPNIPKLRGR